MKLILNGYTGKMGSVVYNYLKGHGFNFIKLGDINNKITEEDIRNCDAIIDFSTPSSAVELFNSAVKFHKNIIIGTTGFTNGELEYFEEKSKNSGISMFVVYNFLPSIHRLKYFIDRLDFEKIYLLEKHHKSKKDKPSGTAKFLLKNLDERKVECSSVRTDFYCYEHRIEIINEFETIEISHRCYNKIGYAKGVEIALNQLGTFIGMRQDI